MVWSLKSTLCLLILLLLSRLLLAQTHLLSLETALQYAREKQLSVQQLRYDSEIAGAKLKQEKAAHYPKISADLDSRYNAQLPTQILPGDFRNLPGQNIPVVFGTKYSTTAALEGSYTIFDPERKYQVEHAKLEQEIAQNNLLTEQTDVALEVKKAYYSCLINQQKIKLTRGNLQRNEAFYWNTQTLFRNGQAQPIDVDRAKLNFQTQQAELQNATQNFEKSLLNLKYQTGLPLDSAVILTDTLLLSTAQPVFELNIFDLKARPEYLNLLLQQEQENLLLTRNKKLALPTLSFYGYYGSQAYRDNFTFLDFQEKWYPLSYAGAQLNWVLFEGFYRKVLVQESKITRKRRKVQLQIFERDYTFQIYDKLLSLKNEQQNLKIREDNVQLAEKVLRVTRIRFEQSLEKSQAVTDAENDLLNAQTNYLNALYDFTLARLEYERIAGK
ncbi:TolC family protein [Adhaeribacter terreus]|uniref:TolC family protein n=1 Tax=Adhaeribacter terreus TaxID=529703 RepID=A0ABW0E676_9BACT